MSVSTRDPGSSQAAEVEKYLMAWPRQPGPGEVLGPSRESAASRGLGTLGCVGAAPGACSSRARSNVIRGCTST
ncbi:hypothetical protein [Acidilobus sp.]|uniref:hypothetical protein n=1 Tax=Acidilobus sp. TaxID=1872109 RepID=UPI003D0071C5